MIAGATHATVDLEHERRSSLAPRTVRMIGIGGAGMRSLAHLLAEAGWQVSGSDCDPMAASLPWPAGIEVVADSSFDDECCADAVRRSDVVIYSPAVPPGDRQRRIASAQGVSTTSYPRFVAQLMNDHRGVAIAGTHGKSTTTALVARMLTIAGANPAVLCGAQPLDCTSGGRLGDGPWLVAEACEYRSNFLAMAPEAAVVLNVDFDHPDCFADLSEVGSAFSAFARRVRADGLLVASADCPRTLAATQICRARRITFGLERAADWQARPAPTYGDRQLLEIFYRRRPVGRVETRLLGHHNAANVLAAVALSAELGIDFEAIASAVADFPGLVRRLERRGTVAGIELWDDYAHHPAAVRAGLAALRRHRPERRIVVVFEPHQRLRTRRLLDEFAAELHNADAAVIAPTFAAREPKTEVESPSRQLAARLTAQGHDAVALEEPREMVDWALQRLRPGDVVVTMGAGRVRKISDVFVERL